MKNRAGRVVFGLIVLILFAVYAYLQASVSPHSKDIGAPASPEAPAFPPAGRSPEP